MRRLAAILAPALVFAACGGGVSTFPEEVECVQPSPLPTSRTTPGAVSPQAYFSRIQNGVSALEKLRSDLRSKYPEDTFYRREAFRPDFAAYADETICTATALLALTPPDGRFENFESTLDTALTALIDHTRAGREAVKSRNVSEYRDWFDGADAKIAAVRTALAAR